MRMKSKKTEFEYTCLQSFHFRPTFSEGKARIDKPKDTIKY